MLHNGFFMIIMPKKRSEKNNLLILLVFAGLDGGEAFLGVTVLLVAHVTLQAQH